MPTGNGTGSYHNIAAVERTVKVEARKNQLLAVFMPYTSTQVSKMYAASQALEMYDEIHIWVHEGTLPYGQSDT